MTEPNRVEMRHKDNPDRVVFVRPHAIELQEAKGFVLVEELEADEVDETVESYDYDPEG